MVKIFVQALCLMAAAARCAVAMPYRGNEWPFSEIIHESPFEYHRRAAMAAAGIDASRTLPPCATETPTGLGPTVSPDTASAFSAFSTFKNTATNLGVSNSSFLVSVVNDDDAYEYSGNTYLGWMNQATYSPYNCQLACNALNATGVKCNTYNTCEYYSMSIYSVKAPPPGPIVDAVTKGRGLH